MKISLLILLVSFLHCSEDNAADIRFVMNTAVSTINAGDVDGHMDTMHPNSPNYKATLQATISMIQKYKPTVEIVDYHYIGIIDDYALVRVIQRNTFTAGGFKGTDVRIVHSLKRDGEKWKMWAIMQLDMTVRK